jgi:predicted site-specific integrase-resolvase
MYSLRQVADMTDTQIETVRRWVRHGRVPVERIGPLTLKRVRVRHSVLAQLFPHLSLVIPTHSAPQTTDNR